MTKTTNFVRALVIITIITLLFSVSTIYVNAEDKNTLKINEKEFNTGDIVTYILKFSDIKEPIIAVDMSVYFDSEHLSLIKDSINVPVFSSAVCNSNLKGEIRFNAVDVTKGYDFSKEQIAISASFKVLKSTNSEKDTAITYTVREMYNKDKNDPNKTIEIKDYGTQSDIIIGKLSEITPANDGSDRLAQLQKEENKEMVTETTKEKGFNLLGNNLWMTVSASMVAILIIIGIIYIIKNNKKTHK